MSSDKSESTWSTEGVETMFAEQNPETKVYDVVCKSAHLTSFAVLLDVNNVQLTVSLYVWGCLGIKTKLHCLVVLGKVNLVAIVSHPDLLAGAENRPL